MNNYVNKFTEYHNAHLNYHRSLSVVSCVSELCKAVKLSGPPTNRCYLLQPFQMLPFHLRETNAPKLTLKSHTEENLNQRNMEGK